MIKYLSQRMSFRGWVVLGCAILSGHMASAQPNARRCPLANPVIAVAPEVFVAGLGHLYIGGGETKRGRVLLGSMLAGAALVVGSAATGAGETDHSAHDRVIDAGGGLMIASYLLSIGDIIPALIREQRRCQRGDARSRFTAQAMVLPAVHSAGMRPRAAVSIRIGVP